LKIALLYYDEFSEFEVVLVCLLFRRYDLITIALENREYRSEEYQRFCVDQAIKDVDVDAIDLLVIPGGEPAPLVDNLELKSFVENLVARNKKVAGICGGAALLAGLGVLKGRKCTGLASGKIQTFPVISISQNQSFRMIMWLWMGISLQRKDKPMWNSHLSLCVKWVCVRRKKHTRQV